MTSDRRDHYRFFERRDGDTMTVATSAERARVVSAFIRWKARRPGTLMAKSKKTEDGYLITFTGISPAEANRAHLAASQQEDI